MSRRITFVGGVLASTVTLQSLLGGGTSALKESGTVRSLHDWHREVTTPAMLMVWALGIVLAQQGGWFTLPWLQAKLALVVVLSAIHGVQLGAMRRLAGGLALRMQGLRFSGRLMIVLVAGIAMLAIIKPGATSLTGYKVARIDRKTGLVTDFVTHPMNTAAVIFVPNGFNKPIDVRFRGPEMFVVDFGVGAGAPMQIPNSCKIWKVTHQ